MMMNWHKNKNYDKNMHVIRICSKPEWEVSLPGDNKNPQLVAGVTQ